MKNKIITISADELNSGSVVCKDMTMHLTGNFSRTDGGQINETLMPGQIFVCNNTGLDLVYNTFADDAEYERSLDYPEFYSYVSLKDESILQNTHSLKIKYFCVQNKSGDTTSVPLDVEGINYKKLF